MNFGRTAAKALATALVASAALTGTAHAVTGTIGPTDLATTGAGITDGGGVTLNTEYSGGAALEVPVKSTITGWQGNFDCTDACGEVRLVLVRPTTDPDVFTVIDATPWTAPPGAGVRLMPATMNAEQHDLLALEGRTGGKVAMGPQTGGRTFLSEDPIVGGMFTRDSTGTGQLALYNAIYLALQPSETTVEATPNPVTVNETVTLTAHVTGASVGSADPDPDPTGTVTFSRSSAAVPGCVNRPLTDGVATCSFQASSYSDAQTYDASYSGDLNYETSDDSTDLRIRDVASVSPSVLPDPVARHMPVTYVAEISGAAVTGEASPFMPVDYGTVAFSVDGVPIAECAARPVGHDDVATCETLAPLAGGTHTLKTDFSGATYLTPATGSTPFVVLAPAVTLPETADFASVAPGSASARTVTLSNSGDADLNVATAGIDAAGAFTISADACTGKTLAPGAGCDVQVAFSPAAAGPYAATLVFEDDSLQGTHSTALTGAGVAAPVPPAPPAPTPPTATPTPTPTPQPGATLAPGAKPTLTVTAPSSSNPNAAPTLSLPLSCPANQECQLDGTLKINTSSLSKSVRAAAAETTTVARFSKVQIAQGKLKTIKLKLSRSFVKSAQKRGIRSIKATLTINTVLGNGERITTRQQVTVLIPKAAKRKVAAPKARPKFTG